MRYILLSSLLFCGTAGACSISNLDLRNVIEKQFRDDQVDTYEYIDGNSEEPILRYTISGESGDIIILEQKHCEIYNLRLSILSVESVPSSKSLVKIQDILSLTVVWSNFFDTASAGRLAEDLVLSLHGLTDKEKSVFFPLGSEFYTASENSEVYVDYQIFDSYTFQFRSQLSLSISVGGL